MVEKKTVGIIALITAILGGMAGMSLDPELTYYKCDSKGLVSDCINGVKACDDDICTRCYHNATNSYQYKYCREGWQVFQQGDINEMNGSTPLNEAEYKVCLIRGDEKACIGRG